MPSHSADYWYLELALANCKAAFAQLKSDMDTFVARQPTDFEVERNAMWAQMRPLNAHLSDAELHKYIQGQIDMAADPQYQFQNRFSEAFSAQAVSIVVLSHALCEAFINAALALGLHHASKNGVFSLIEKTEIKEKLINGPSTFLESYLLPKSGALFENLSSLSKERNAFTHHKIGLKNDDGQVIHERNKSTQIRMDSNGTKKIEKYLDLPFALLKNLCDQTTDTSLRFRFECLASRRLRP
jgi:hypothetical protein